MENEILTLLGLHQRPKTVKQGYESSAPKFMISLYNSLKTDDGDVISDEIEFNSKVNLTLGKAMEHINGTDVIRSFINHGKHHHGNETTWNTNYFSFVCSPEHIPLFLPGNIVRMLT